MTSTKSTHTYNGSCLCGSISITLALNYDLYAGPNGHLCHCSNCRKSTGGPSAMCLMIQTSAVELSDPKKRLKVYQDNNTKSGRAVPRSFCSECGSSIGCVPTTMDERLSIVAWGLFDEVPEPVFECFASQRLPWNKAVADEDKQYAFIDEVINHVPRLA